MFRAFFPVAAISFILHAEPSVRAALVDLQTLQHRSVNQINVTPAAVFLNSQTVCTKMEQEVVPAVRQITRFMLSGHQEFVPFNYHLNSNSFRYEDFRFRDKADISGAINFTSSMLCWDCYTLLHSLLHKGGICRAFLTILNESGTQEPLLSCPPPLLENATTPLFCYTRSRPRILNVRSLCQT